MSSDSQTGSDADTPTDYPVGVKLGSTRTVVKTPDDLERTLTCLATYEDPLTGEEKVLYGQEAAVEYPDRVQYMLRSGLPEDDENAEAATTFFEAFMDATEVPPESGLVYAVPTIDNEEGVANLEEVVESSPVGETFVRAYPESLCGSVPCFDGLDALDTIFVAVNLGSTNLEACAYRRGEQLAPYATGGVTGNEVDRTIVSYVEEETQGRVKVDITTAREYKEQHADFEDYEPFTDVVQQPGGGSHEFTIEDSVMDAVDEYVDSVVDEIANEFLPELANNYMKVYKLALDEQVVLTGGMACIPGLVEEVEERLCEELQRDVVVTTADSPELAAAEGAHRIAEQLMVHQD
jgi:hypothetical protein